MALLKYNETDTSKIEQGVGRSYGKELEYNLDRYANWNNPANPKDQQAAFAERDKGLAELKNLEAYWTGKGIDPSSVPEIQKFYTGFGATPGAGTTSEQAAAAVKAGGSGSTAEDMFRPPAVPAVAPGAPIQQVTTGQPSPTTVNATPFTGLQMPTGAGAGGVTGGTDMGNLKAGFAAATASGKEAPDNAGAAASAITKFTPPAAPPQPQIQPEVQNFLQNSPLVQQSMQELTDFLSPASTRKELADSMNKIVTDQKELAGLKMELADVSRIMGGSEDEIRQEIEKMGGFGTESQVQALTVARNKTLLKKASMIQDKLNYMQDVINSDMTMYGFQKEAAQQEFQQRSFLLQYKQQNDQFIYKANQEAVQRNLDLLGPEGLLKATGNDPVKINQIERTLGIIPGGLYEAATAMVQKRNLTELSQYNIPSRYVIKQSGEVVDSETGTPFTDPLDFEEETGMTLAQAEAKGMLKRLGMTREQEQQTFENTLAKDKFEFDKQTANRQLALEGARVGLSAAANAREQAKFKLEQDAQKNANIANIIKANPGEWGKAADIIEANYGKIATGSPIDTILKAHYEKGANVDQMLTGGGSLDDVYKSLQIEKLTRDLTGQTNSKDLTADQSKARQFANSAADANKILADLGYNPGNFEFSGIPILGLGKIDYPNQLKSSARQQFEQASRAFVNATLRRESGATITDDEFKNKYKELIPAAGDSKEVKLNKAAARESALRSIKEAGLVSSSNNKGSDDPLGIK